MRNGSLRGRLSLFVGDRAVDVERRSEGRFGADPQAVYARWQEFLDWTQGLGDQPGESGESFDPADLGAPVPRPPQVFGIGLNYRDHAAEGGFGIPAAPMVFTKFPSSVTGPTAVVRLPSDHIDWEAEVVAVIGLTASHVAEGSGWDHVAGLMAGQDLSDRKVQFRDTPPQFSLGKSFPGFAPTGPWVVTLDELPDRERIEVGCRLGNDVLQAGSTSDLIFGIGELVEQLSVTVTLLPGDLIFTGTPAGVGAVQDPPKFLHVGDVLTTTVQGVGSIVTTFS